ncbi:TPA: hypothetical protein QHC28_002284 [Aeromonas veronii bv. veronii]|nr:hypothetical protein [Aeromonas veronii bv. veronii]
MNWPLTITALLLGGAAVLYVVAVYRYYDPQQHATKKKVTGRWHQKNKRVRR